jgi:hypothetical protein
MRDYVEKPVSIKYLRTMKKYYNRLKGMPHYQQYKDMLESFTIDFAYHSNERRIGIKKIWEENF